MTNNPMIDSVSRVLLAPDREMRVYIAGPMTGIKDYNFPAFNAMAGKLRAAGWHVENPADHGLVIGAEWGDYLRYDIGRLASCEAIVLLPGWTASRGARLEVSIAKELGAAFMYAEGAEHADADSDAPAVERQGPDDALSKGFYTTQSGGGNYSINIGFRTLAEMQSADKQMLEVLRNRSGVAALQSTIAQLQARIGELESGRGDDWLSMAHEFQLVGLKYWDAHQRERGDGAVKFLHNDETGAMFVVTRGEYAKELKDFIFGLDATAALNKSP